MFGRNSTYVIYILCCVFVQLRESLALSPKIVIIGSGPSGLACATKLLENGFENVTIVEAESRIGGRIHTVSFADNVVDMGAQWCHGHKDNIVYETVEKYDLLSSISDEKRIVDFIRSNGECLDSELQNRLMKIMEDNFNARQKDLESSTASLGTYLWDKVNATLQQAENSDIDKAIAEEAYVSYDKVRCSYDGADTLNEVSGRGQLEYWECEGDIYLNWKGKGYREFLRVLLKTNETGKEHGVLEERIQLDRKVRQVNWNCDGGGKALITFENGEEMEADHVIVTVSLGVLKANHATMFEPQLPLKKQRAIDGIGFGTINKIYLEFSEPFWSEDWLGVTLLWREADIAEIRGTKQAWLEAILGFYVVEYQPRLLSAWLVGPYGRQMETLPIEQVQADCMYLLERFLKRNISEPINILRTTWSTNTNFRGSYAFHSMHMDEVGATIPDLAEPLFVGKNYDEEQDLNVKDGKNAEVTVLKPLIQFAGEATHEHRYSTVHGAVETGFREAKRLIDYYDVKKI